MTQHVSEWLGAYYDGELSRARAAQVAQHLESCEACRAEFDALRSLSGLLQENATAERAISPDRFCSQVMLRLPARPLRTRRQVALEAGWWSIPLGLLGLLGFAQSTFIITGMVAAVLWLGQVHGFALPWLPSSRPGRLFELSGFLAQELGMTTLSYEIWPLIEVLLLGGILPVLLFAVVAVAYWSWLATWWARLQHRGVDTL
ncbi:MAG: anti-sigma factor [Anaerolineae bacterium]|jgi:predicted anti-sigma-YlaC factor YlaD|nr:anti-sigma factor [Anaerolineae bacterium]